MSRDGASMQLTSARLGRLEKVVVTKAFGEFQISSTQKTLNVWNAPARTKVFSIKAEVSEALLMSVPSALKLEVTGFGTINDLSTVSKKVWHVPTFYPTATNIQAVLSSLAGETWSTIPSISAPRQTLRAMGTALAGLAVGGYNGLAYFQRTETFDGTNWTQTAGSLSIGRANFGGCGSQSSALVSGGQNGSSSSMISTEKWNGTSWSSGADMNTSRSNNSTCGSQSAALTVANWTVSNGTETFNGTSWSVGPTMNSDRDYPGNAGTLSAALAFGKLTGYLTSSESFDGSSWSTGNSLNVGRGSPGYSGTLSSALAFGGMNAPISTEGYNGTVWATKANLNVNHYAGPGGAGSGFSSICVGGRTTSADGNYTAVCEQYHARIRSQDVPTLDQLVQGIVTFTLHYLPYA